MRDLPFLRVDCFIDTEDLTAGVFWLDKNDSQAGVGLKIRPQGD